MIKIVKTNYKNFFLLIGIISLIIGTSYLFIFYIKSNKDSIQKKNEKIYIVDKDKWCENQKKYIHNSIKFFPITFESKKNETSQETIRRHGYITIRKNAVANLLLCHGFMTTKEDMALLRCLFTNYNIITFDFRAHGENITSQSCTIGCDEKNDVIAAANYIKKNTEINNLPTFVYGFSMGAVASILAQSENPHLFAGAIWDCPYESTNNLLHQALNQFSINCNGYRLPMPFQSVISKYFYNKNAQSLIKTLLKVFSSIDGSRIETLIKNISPREALKKITIPFFLIGCHNDDKAPAHSIKKMYLCQNDIDNSNKPYSKCWISAGRRHFDTVILSPEKYIYKVNKFISKVIDDNKEKKIIEIKSKKKEKQKLPQKTESRLKMEKNNFLVKRRNK